MCLAIPMRLVQIDGTTGVAEVDGVKLTEEKVDQDYKRMYAIAKQNMPEQAFKQEAPKFKARVVNEFIAKTLLERTGAQVEFQNGKGGGAVVAARWRREAVGPGERAAIEEPRARGRGPDRHGAREHGPLRVHRLSVHDRGAAGTGLCGL